MFKLPQVKKTLTGLVSVKRIKKVVAGVMLSAGLLMAHAAIPTGSDAAMSKPHYGISMDQTSQMGALVLTSPTGGLTRTAWHESHASHASHESHASHYSSRY